MLNLYFLNMDMDVDMIMDVNVNVDVVVDVDNVQGHGNRHALDDYRAGKQRLNFPESLPCLQEIVRSATKALALKSAAKELYSAIL